MQGLLRHHVVIPLEGRRTLTCLNHHEQWLIGQGPGQSRWAVRLDASIKGLTQLCKTLLRRHVVIPVEGGASARASDHHEQ